MKRVLMSLIAGLLLVPLAACCGDKSKTCGTPASQPAATAPAGGETQMSLMKDMLAVLKTVDSKESAEAAKPKLEAIEKRMMALRTQMQPVAMEMQSEMMRVMQDPELAAALGMTPPAPRMPASAPAPGTLEDYEALYKIQIDMTQKRLAILKEVKDVETAKAAREKLSALAQEYMAQAMNRKPMGPPTDEQQKTLEAKFSKDTEALDTHMEAERKRLEAMPEVFEILTGQSPTPPPAPEADSAPMP